MRIRTKVSAWSSCLIIVKTSNWMSMLSLRFSRRLPESAASHSCQCSNQLLWSKEEIKPKSKYKLQMPRSNLKMRLQSKRMMKHWNCRAEFHGVCRLSSMQSQSHLRESGSTLRIPQTTDFGRKSATSKFRILERQRVQHLLRKLNQLTKEHKLKRMLKRRNWRRLKTKIPTQNLRLKSKRSHRGPSLFRVWVARKTWLPSCTTQVRSILQFILLEISHFVRKTIIDRAKTFWAKELKEVAVNSLLANCAQKSRQLEERLEDFVENSLKFGRG